MSTEARLDSGRRVCVRPAPHDDAGRDAGDTRGAASEPGADPRADSDPRTHARADGYPSVRTNADPDVRAPESSGARRHQADPEADPCADSDARTDTRADARTDGHPEAFTDPDTRAGPRRHAMERSGILA